MYKPTSPKALEVRELGDWTYRELVEIERSFYNLEFVRLVQTNVAPDRPRAGDIRFADGTNWNPGSGAGFYGYHSGAWAKLG